MYNTNVKKSQEYQQKLHNFYIKCKHICKRDLEKH